ncbi:hypothetical protein ACFSF7_13600, partial [Ligilactobacillus acidipiscis]|uniref:hypothetical protein n=1 Tax=Ligilactobacillus acidipiscis TaxID=89059 RepID=UPI003641F9D4
QGYPPQVVSFIFCFLRLSHCFHLQDESKLLLFSPSPLLATMASADFCHGQLNITIEPVPARNNFQLERTTMTDLPG